MNKEERIKKHLENKEKLKLAKLVVDQRDPSYHILSFGAGVQTQAMLIKLTPLFSNNPKAYVVFADTGGEHQETYDYIEKYTIPWCKKHNIQFVRVYNKYGKTLYDYCWDKKIVPSIKFRDCTSKFKISPIRKFMTQVLGINRKDACNLYIGISSDESDRMNPSSIKYAYNVYPLIDGYRNYITRPMTREDCQATIILNGWEECPKSGCWFCPFSKTADFLKQKEENPEQFVKIINLEERNSRYPEIKLRGMGKSVKTVRELTSTDISMDSCRSGHCMV